MKKRLFGLETEIAFNVACRPGQDRPKEDLVRHFMEFVKAKIPHISDGTPVGFYTQNGSRIYVDCGLHPEVDTPECSDPWELVRFQVAGEQMMGEMLEGFVRGDASLAEGNAFLCNVDYSGTCATFGSHESYLHETDPGALAPQMLPHLVSRVIYTGAGGFNPVSPGLEFTLSPRAFHLVKEVSAESTRDRGIFHTKDEPLCSQYHRLHLLCGESLCSQTATWLRVGTTALVVALIEAGLHPGDAVRLRSPLDALKAFAQDPTCKAVAESADGKGLTAGMVQRHYLAEVERHLRDPFMPDWAESVCREWRRILDLVRDGPDSVTRILDWAMKYSLYKDTVTAAGFAWDSLPLWNHVMTGLTDALARSVSRNQRVPVDVILSESSPIPEAVKQLSPWVISHGLRWDDLSRFILLRYRMLETDTRFAQLGSRGIFHSLNRSAVLQHRVAEIGDIEAAVALPPASGRAKLRGEMVRTLAGSNGRFVCRWDSIVDLQENRIFDMSDPFSEEGQWQTEDPGRLPSGMPPDVAMAVMMQFRRRRAEQGARTT